MFDSAFEKTVLLEGVYSNAAKDKGGETKYGISKTSYPDEDTANLTLERAKFLYLRDFWNKLRLSEIKNEIIQDEVFDTAVNGGRMTAVLVMQRSINFLSNAAVLKEDGLIGSKTIDAINLWCRKDPIVLFKVLNGFQFIHYVEVTKKDPSHSFPRGWMKRIQEHGDEEAKTNGSA